MTALCITRCSALQEDTNNHCRPLFERVANRLRLRDFSGNVRLCDIIIITSQYTCRYYIHAKSPHVLISFTVLLYNIIKLEHTQEGH